MRTIVSIPDKLFEEAKCLARLTKRSPSSLLSDALSEYLERHSPDKITEAMNAVCKEIDDTEDAFVSAAARRILEKSEWQSRK
jgi:metal-responsive CopG/Arc/MetJ family transcriptional regulator